MHILDETDRQLIAQLRHDARLPVATLAQRLGVSRATAKTRLDRLVETGVIERFTVELGGVSEHAGVRAITLIEVEGKVADRVARALLGLPEVHALHSTNGRWDLIAEIETDSLQSFDEALRQIRLIDGVNLTETSIMLATRLRSSRRPTKS